MKHTRLFLRTSLLACVTILWTPAVAQEWIQLAPVGAPPDGRWDVNAVYDPSSNRLIVFGGLTSINAGDGTAHRNDVWVLTNANGLGGIPEWIQLTPSGTPPDPRRQHSVVYDAASNRMILFGGHWLPTVPEFNDVWVLTDANGTAGTSAWIALSPSGAPPPPRGSHAAAYDAVRNRMVIQGGAAHGSGDKNDTWVLTNANNLGGTPEWIELVQSGDVPSPTRQNQATYDSLTNRMTLRSVDGPANTTKVRILENANGLGGPATWMALATGALAPSTRVDTKGGYDEGSNRMISFGGTEPFVTGAALNDTWALTNANGIDPSNWVEVVPSNSPPSLRIRPAAVYDQSSNRLIVFGGCSTPVDSGCSGTLFNEVWVLTSANGVIEIAVEIDIKPDSDPNSINLKSRGRTPVAILGSFDFDVAIVNVPTVRFAGAAPVRSSTEDVNNDGHPDLVLHFLTQSLQLTADSTQATLTGMTTDGNSIKGTGTVQIVQ